MASNAPTNDNNTLSPMATPATASSAPSAPHNLPNDILHPVDSAPTPGTETPPQQLNAEQRSLSLKVSLADLAARASHHYAQKHYDDAAEIYAQAAEMQAEMNGEMSPDNAEILFLYGRSLFKVGQAKSDVLGGRAPAVDKEGEKRKRKNAGAKRKAKAEAAAATAVASASAVEKELAAAEEEKVVQKVAARAAKEGEQGGKKELEGKKQMFQFTGDEDWDDSCGEDEDDAAGGEGEEDDEEDDDLATAFEILDLARVLLRKKLDDKLGALEASEGKGKEVASGGTEDAEARHIKERLADTHDLLMEISLENERYVFVRRLFVRGPY